jgi:nucleoside-diphosphate-sugar epimerase
MFLPRGHALVPATGNFRTRRWRPDQNGPKGEDVIGTRVFLAGATGAIGKRLIPLLLPRGAVVFGTTRSTVRTDELRSSGIEPIVVDVFDAPALTWAMVKVEPDVVVHQLTDLALIRDLSRLAEALTRNGRLRTEGTRNLVAAAMEAGARRLIAQSIAWIYAPGPEPHAEEDPLNLGATGMAAITVQGVVALEQAVLTMPKIEGIVLRYGWLYGPGTGTTVAAGSPPLHVDAAALAAALAIEKGAPGIYNIAEPSPSVSVEKARRELGWDPSFRAPSP